VEIAYVVGDATQPEGSGPRVIVHLCNDIGGWGRGFVLALSRRWAEPERRYRAWHRGEEATSFALGQVQFVLVKTDLWVANLIGQHGVDVQDGQPPIRYEAVREGLARVAAFATKHGASVHMPRIGTGLAGGSWDVIANLIRDELMSRDIPVTVYDLPK
jgi:O-acetyl-ADP-ribose deacetylase (regulator of RNase III)